jgi:hypothetical protein
MKAFATAILLLGTLCTYGQSPEIACWIRNTTGAAGYGGIPSNVQTVQYSSQYVYVSCTCIPGYSIGPWAGNPNIPANQNFVFKITRTPAPNTGSPTVVGLGHIGVWSNGVTIFNPKDAASYNNAGVWHQNAYFFEGSSFDNCLGHPAPNGEYHHHINPRCLYNDADSTHHSPIIGYAFDGFPVYGAYGYANPDGTGGIRRMTSSYALTTTTTRTNGPAVDATFPAGAYCEDYTYTAGYGSLDEHNGRFCVTPDYPAGTYAYFVTIDAALNPVYPFVIGNTYYGQVTPGNTGPGSGHVTIAEPTTTYTGSTGIAALPGIAFSLVPNPVSSIATLYLAPSSPNNISATLLNAQGQAVRSYQYLQPSIAYTIDCSGLGPGMYYLHLRGGDEAVYQKILVLR